MGAEDQIVVSAAARAIRRWHEGRLASSGVGADARFVIDDRQPTLVVFTEPDALASDAPALLIPEEADPEIEMLLDLNTPGPDGAQRDRWRAYHGPDRRGVWACALVESVRLRISPGPAVFDAPEVLQSNPLCEHVAQLIQRANQRPDRLASAVRARLGAASVDPVAVGADPWGLDVRARFGVVRLEFAAEAPDADAAAAAVDAILELAP